MKHIQIFKDALLNHQRPFKNLLLIVLTHFSFMDMIFYLIQMEKHGSSKLMEGNYSYI
jgi:hypothetical protein